MPGYRVPTNLELVERADAIVLARVDDAGPSGMAEIRKARLVPVASLKGSGLPLTIRFDDAVLSNEQMEARASDPRNLVDTNPDAFGGSCNRYLFDKGMLLVVFLLRDGTEMVADRSPFARTLEDVPSADALWVKAVKTYVEIGGLSKQKRRKEIARRRDMLSYELDDADSRLLALELARALREARN
ncbi:MAG: hypothetical protein EOP60_02545 [Sphingomonadales bacterium]|nr:MAG: hypothetical protein EOP60_02545 [Sphingomonadales bacterium]